MMGSKEISTITLEGLLAAAEAYHRAGYRLVQICGLKNPDDSGIELHYTFDKAYALVDLKLTIPAGVTLPSISPIYYCAFLYENELHDLFGISVEGNRLDFKGHLYKLAVPTPFNPPPTIPEKPTEE
jgi:ech hydrogenase subunit D